MQIDFCAICERFIDTYGDRLALVNIERGRRYTHREYHRLTNQIHNMLEERMGLKKGDRYMPILKNDNLSLMCWYMALKGQAIACFTNYRDSMGDHLRQIDLSGTSLVVLENELIDLYYQPLKDRGIAMICMDEQDGKPDDVHYFWDLLEGVSDVRTGKTVDDQKDTVMMRFTGGTTGAGKCTEHSVDGMMSTYEVFYQLPDTQFTSETRALHFAPISHGTALLFMPTLFRGGCNYTVNEPGINELPGIIEREKITVTLGVPTLLYRLLEIPGVEDYDLSSLDTFMYGAAPINGSKLGQLIDRFGNIFVQVYGGTECIRISISLSKADHNADIPARLASAGRVVPGGSDVRIMDDDGQPVNLGQRGELWLRNRSICLGYYNNPEKTAEEFTKDGFWKSGDIGIMDEDGFITIVDRKKDMIITGGFNVYATEVEGAIAHHPAVLMSAVVGIPHEEWGEAVHAEVVLREGMEATEDEIRALVRGKLGKYQAPKSVTFVDELPLSAVGKVLRRDVRDKYWIGQDKQVG